MEPAPNGDGNCLDIGRQRLFDMLGIGLKLAEELNIAGKQANQFVFRQAVLGCR